jgi:serine phosphatase RsbU (regulator of sigma subunit)/Tfp pilus assembly protein PilF
MKVQFKRIVRLALFLVALNPENYFSQLFEGQDQEQYLFLKSEIANAKNDTTVVKALVYKSELFYSKYPDSVVPICNRAIALADENLSRANSNEKRVYLLYKASAISNLGFIYEDFGDIPKAIEHYTAAMKIQEQIQDEEGVANTLINLGVINEYQEEIGKALEYYKKAYDIQLKINDKRGAAFSLNNIGGLYEHKNDYQSAIGYHLKSLKLREELGDKKNIAQSLNNVGANHFFMHQYEEAIGYFQRALDLRIEMGDRPGMCNSYENFAKLYSEQNELLKAEVSGLKALEIAKELHFPEVIKGSSEVLYIVYKKMNRPAKALEMHELYTTMKDSIRNDDTKKASLKSQLQYVYDKKMVADSVRVQEEKKVINAQLQEEKTKKYALYGGLLLVVVFALFVLNRFKISQKQKAIIQEQKHVVEEKHKEITDSINYAERIQRSLLASNDMLRANLNNYFVLFKPKDVVSGDFYWAAKLSNGNFVTVTADSTGHGVPGAIMSIVNIASLKEAVSKGITSPDAILNETRRLVIENLRNDGTEHGGKDGMDASLLSFDFNKKTLYCANANNPVWIIRHNELMEIKADRMPVGKHDKDTFPFTLQTINLQKGDMVYTLTDGFPDQFGGEKGKKFKYKQLQDFLLSVYQEPMEVQQQKLNRAFDIWKGNLEQVDDVTIMGILI